MRAGRCATVTVSRDFVRVEEAAARLGIGRTLAWKLVRAGRIPSIRLGKRVLVPVRALERLAEEAAHQITT